MHQYFKKKFSKKINRGLPTKGRNMELLDICKGAIIALLYIEPTGEASREPLIDEVSRKMTAAFRKYTRTGIFDGDGEFKAGSSWRGFHGCSCGVMSSSVEFELPDMPAVSPKRIYVNSLAIHYVTRHRSSIPLEMIDLIKKFDCGEEDPTIAETHGSIRVER